MATKAEKEIAQSTGNATDKWADKLEQEADDIINDFYHKGEDKDGSDNGLADNTGDEDKGEKQVADVGDGSDGSGDGDGTEDTDGETGQGDKETDGDGEDGGDDNDNDTDNTSDNDSDNTVNVKDLLADRDRFQKQAKDNKSEYTKGQQKLKEVIGRTEEMEDTIFNLRSKIEDLSSSTQTKQEDKETKKEIKREAVDVASQLKAISEIDPDIATAMTPVIEDLVGKIESLKTEIATSNATAKVTAEEAANNAYYTKVDRAVPGWEDTMKTDEFADYIDGLSPRQKRMALSDLKAGSADDVIEVFKDYTSTLPEVKKANNKKDKIKKASEMANPNLNKSKEVETGKTFKYKLSDVRRMNEKDYLEKETEIDKAWAAGQIDMNN